MKTTISEFRIDGVAKAADSRDPCSATFHPILFSGSIKHEKQHRLILRVYAYALSKISIKQVTMVYSGILVISHPEFYFE